MSTSTFGASVNRRTALKGLAGLGIAAAGLGLGLSLDRTPALAEDKKGNTHTVLDLEGTEIEVPVPEELERIVVTSFKGAFPAALILGQVDKIYGMGDLSKYTWLLKALPQLNDIKNFGTFDNVNVEELLAANPDVVIAPARSSETTVKMREVGITVAVDGTGGTLASDAVEASLVLEDVLEEVRLVSELTGTEDRAAEYTEWVTNQLNFVNERVKDIPEDERVRVLPVRNELLQVFDSNYICGKCVELAGGINVARDCAASTGKFYADVDAETIIEWNPDMLFVINFTSGLTEENDSYQEWASDNRYAEIPAMKNGDVYLIPTMLEQWDASSQAAIGVTWMAKVMYPDLFEDVDIKTLVNEFYKKFLDIEVAEEDWAIIAPQYTGANSNGLI